MDAQVRRSIETFSRHLNFDMDRQVAGLENGVGLFLQGLGPGPQGPSRPIPIFLQVLDAKSFNVKYRQGDTAYQILANDQKRFQVPRAIPPILSLQIPGDDDNRTDNYLVSRHAYSEGAFELLHELVEGGLKFTLLEFLRFAQSLAEALAFLHEHRIVHGQWNARSVLAVPSKCDNNPFEGSKSYRYDLLNTGVFYADPEAIPVEHLEREYFPREIFPGASRYPDFEALDLEADVFCFSAFLKDLFQRASRFEELTRQAAKIRDYFHREAIRRGNEPTKEGLLSKEQEILDHLYTIKARIEDMIEAGLRDRPDRENAARMHERSKDLYERTVRYRDLLVEKGFEEVNVFGDELERYVPYQIAVRPFVVNNFEDTEVTVTGEGLPREVVRVSLGEHESFMEVLESASTKIRFRIPGGFPVGTQPIHINNRRTNQSIKVIAPKWEQVIPSHVRKPWEGFGNIVMRVAGQDLPESPTFALAPELTENEDDTATFTAIRAERVSDTLVGHPSDSDDSFAVGMVPSVVYELEFPEECPVGQYRLLCNELDTKLAIVVGEALPDPLLDRRGIEPREILNHREQKVVLRGKNFHSSMVVDLGEGAPLNFRFELHPGSSSTGTLTLPAGFLQGEYPIRVNRVDVGARLRVKQVRWNSVKPESVKLKQKQTESPRIEITGDALPSLDQDVGDHYALRNSRGKVIENAVVKTEEEITTHEGSDEVTRSHTVSLSPDLGRGRVKLFFGEWDTRLELRIHRQFPTYAWAAAAALVLLFSLAVATVVVERSRPVITVIETSDVYNFGESSVLVQGQRLESVVLTSTSRDPDSPPTEHSVPAHPWGSDGESFYFTPHGVPAGEYTVTPATEWLQGSAAESTVRVVSPRFALDFTTAHRLTKNVLTLTSETEYPLADHTKMLTLRRRIDLDPEPDEVLDEESTQSAVDAELSDSRTTEDVETPVTHSGPVADAQTHPLPPAEEPEDVVERVFEFSIRAGGQVVIPSNTFTWEDEGDYDVFLDGELVDGTFTANSEDLVVSVVGPTISAIEPNPVTSDAEGHIQIQIDGQHFPEDLIVGLVGETEEAHSRLEHRLDGTLEDGFTGQVGPGIYQLAWQMRGRAAELAAETFLEVLPPPTITSISPTSVPPEVPVELLVQGMNLVAAENITLTPLAGQGDELVIPLDAERLKHLEDIQWEYLTDEVVLTTGTYSVRPGEQVTLEVIEDCRKLLDAYRTENTEVEELVRCLSKSYASDELRLEGANLLFDQGHFAMAFEIYERLDHQQARFRRALIARELLDQASYPFALLASDEPQSPYARAAAALGWIAAGDIEPPMDPNGPWELDYVRGKLADRAQVAIEALNLSIAKKSSAAGEHEAQPFEPALTALAEARLDLGVSLLRDAKPLTAHRQLETAFFADSAEDLDRLSAESRARACFVQGHTTLWYSGDDASAADFFSKGLAEDGEYATLCQDYLRAIGRSQDGKTHSDRTGLSWEANFVTATALYRKVRDVPNYNILTEKTSAASIFPEERRASASLQKVLKALDGHSDALDPVAQNALFFYVRNAQLQAWPSQSGGEKAATHRSNLESLQLDEESMVVRDFYLLEGQVGPLEYSQIRLMPTDKIREYASRAKKLSNASLAEGLKGRLKHIQSKLKL